ncbi:MAG: tetratricopeptide repeat protein [Candidatus Nanoarchaeia archaeon]
MVKGNKIYPFGKKLRGYLSLFNASVNKYLKDLEEKLSDSSLPLYEKILYASWIGEKIIGGRELKDFEYYKNKLFEIKDELKEKIKNGKSPEEVIRETVKGINRKKDYFLLTDYLETGYGNCAVATSLFLCLSETLDDELFKQCCVGELPRHIIIIKEEGGKKPEYIDFGSTYSAEDYQNDFGEIPKIFEKQAVIAYILINAGVRVSNLGKNKKAIECFNKAIEINPNSGSAWYNKGVAFYDLHKYEEAIKCFDKAIEIEPNFEGAWRNKGLLLYILGKDEEAIECLDKAIEIDPDNERAWSYKGHCLSHLGTQRKC